MKKRHFQCLLHSLESIGSAVLFSTKVITWKTEKKSPIWCLSISQQFSFPVSVHENSFVVTIDINNVVLIPTVMVHMGDVSDVSIYSTVPVH